MAAKWLLNPCFSTPNKQTGQVRRMKNWRSNFCCIPKNHLSRLPLYSSPDDPDESVWMSGSGVPLLRTLLSGGAKKNRSVHQKTGEP